MPPDSIASPASAPSTAPDISLLDVGLVVFKNLWLLLGVPALAAVIAVAASFLVAPTYTSSTVIMTPQKSDIAGALLGQLGGLAGAAGSLADVKNPSDQWVGLLYSRTVADAIVDQFKLVDRYGVKYMFEARKGLAVASTIEAGKNGLITISVDDKDPDTARRMATAYVSELQKLSKNIAVTEAGQRRLFFEQQVRDAREQMDKAIQSLQGGGIAQNAVKTDPGVALEAVARMRAQITAAEVRLSVLRQSMTQRSTAVQQAEAEVRSLKEQLKSIDQPEELVVGGQQGEYLARYRDFKYYENLFEVMAKQFELAKIDEARDGTVIQVVDPAQTPEWKSKPKRLVVGLLAFVIVGFLVLLYVFVREAVRNSRRDPELSAKLAQFRFRRA